MSSVEIIMVGSMLVTVLASVGWCWQHFRQGSKHIVKHDT